MRIDKLLMNLLKKLFGIKPKTFYSDHIKQINKSIKREEKKLKKYHKFLKNS